MYIGSINYCAQESESAANSVTFLNYACFEIFEKLYIYILYTRFI